MNGFNDDILNKMKTNKLLGQNFLINEKILKDIADTAEIESSDVVLEIGAGTGNLTKELAQRAKKVIAVEKDKNLIEGLRANLSEFKNIEIINQDILKFDLSNYKPRLTAPDAAGYGGQVETKNYKLIGNIPYYLTGHLLRIIFEKWARPELIILSIQKEVAQRITAKPPHMSILALMTQYFSEPKIIRYIDKENFKPRPKVDSAVIRLTPNQNQPNPELFNLIKAGFKSRRQTLANNLARHTKISKTDLENTLKYLNINISARAENLSLEQWKNLYENLY